MATREATRLMKAARQGDATAQLTLGQLYLAGGEGLAANSTAAMSWLARAWKGGRAEAAWTMAELPPPGNSSDILTDYVGACRDAAADGSMTAHFSLGVVQARSGDLAAAVDCFRRAAEAGHAAAARRLGELLVAGAGDGAAPQTARAWLEEAAARGDVSAARPLAELLWRQNDPAALPWLRQLAREGDAEAKVRLAELLLRTTAPTPASAEASREAHQWLVQAARTDHPRALLLLGRLHVRWLRGDNFDAGGSRKVPHSPQKAVEYLERSAAQNMPEADWCLAQIYEHPGFGRRDLRRARQHLEAAARAGIAAAQVALARRLMARGADLEASLQAGHWLCAATEDAAVREEAETLLDGLADQAPAFSPEILAAQARLLPRLAESHPRLAARLTLAAAFGLTTREALFLDLLRVDQGWCLLADVQQYFHYKPWRLVRSISDEQHKALRQAVESALPSFRGEDETFPHAVGSTRARARRLESILSSMGIDPGLFVVDWKPPA